MKEGRTTMKRVPFQFILIMSTLIASIFLQGQKMPMAKTKNMKPIQLLKPQMEGGKPLMQALRERKSSRSLSSKELPPQVLSNLLWAAFGVNRPESGKRTAPSAVNWQEIDIYVATAEGLYLYEATAHLLKPILSEDIRAKTTRILQPSRRSIEEAPINLIYVADFSRMGWYASTADKNLYSAAATGFTSQNVYLFCASEGLGTVVRGLVDRKALSEVMRLRKDQKIILAQTVGYIKK
jgi:SagB-type dehydrogenase family enzyme